MRTPGVIIWWFVVAAALVTTSVCLATSDDEMIQRMRQWINDKGRLPTEQDLKAMGPKFRQAWEIYKRRAAQQVPQPTPEEYQLGREMWEWIKNKARDPNATELKNPHLKRCWEAYNKVNEYHLKLRERQADEAVDDARQRFSKAKQSLERKQYAEAIAAFLALLRNSAAKDLHEEIKSLLTQINRLAEAEMAAADSLSADKQYREAMDAYRRIAATFSGLPAAVQAQKSLEALQVNPEAVRALRTERAKQLLGSANAAYWDGNYLDALILYEELAVKFDDTPEAREAGNALAAMRANSAIMAKVEQMRQARDIRRLLSEADACETARLIDLAIDRLRELVDKYPDADEAEPAKARIERLLKIR